MSRVSHLCSEFDEEVPYLWLDAVYEKAREAGRVRSKAVAMATDVTVEGRPTVLAAEKANVVRTSQAGAREALDELSKPLNSKCPKASE
ncbi:MAG: transposase [Deltaproteobacteria bacterium]|nr:transposase [Deltaproteobacteria bacterium]